jgi:carbon monoxide dehydrogenase subunit G
VGQYRSPAGPVPIPWQGIDASTHPGHAGGMSALANDIVIDAPADAVWQVIAHQFDRIGDWATAIRASTAHAPARLVVGAPVAGRVCHTDVRLVATVTETIVAYDEAARTLTYEATDGMPAFVTRARNQWQVTAIGDTQARVAFDAKVDARGLLGALARWWLLAQVARSGRHLLQDLKYYIEHGTPSPRKRRRLGHPSTRTADPVLAVGTWPTTRRLRAALRANAVFSMVSGAVLLVAGWFVAEALGAGPAAVPPLLGVAVASFGALVAWIAVLPAEPLRRWAVGVAAADAAWVIANVALLIRYPLTVPGAVAIAALAAVVAALAAWQLVGLAAARSDDPLADIEVVQAVRVLTAAPADVWPRLTDHDLYGRLAPNLSKVEVISDEGQPLRRRCTNTAGQGWEETCTLWDDGRRFAVDVDTSEYPYPILLMRGLWQVDPDPGGSRVTMRFAYQAIASLRGGLFAIGVRVLSPLVLNRIFRGWQRLLNATPASGFVVPTLDRTGPRRPVEPR